MPPVIILAIYVSLLSYSDGLSGVISDSIVRSWIRCRLMYLWTRPHGCDTDNQYTLCDILLLIQIYYYRHLRRRALARASSSSSSPTEETSLLASSEPPAQPKPLLPPSLLWLEYPILVAFVLAAGAGAWYLSPASDEVGIPENPGRGGEVELEWSSQALGWTSAVLYFASRVPQIAHNL